MSDVNYISAFCRISSGKVNVNHSIMFTGEQDEAPPAFIKSVYKHYQLNYPKFYKMDSLCQLGFIASELLLKDNKLTEKYNKEEIAIVISNGSSSLEIDTEHQQTISDKANYFPSPAVFVYTLPNILIGEIAIRNLIKGENTFFIFDKFDAQFTAQYINSLLNSGRAESCIAGWVDFYEGNYDAFLYTVEKTQGVIRAEHTAEQLLNIYK
ncbi:MAG: 3-oxoacyl-ACP synthase [Bacteroidetes bacterium]|nr:3-oxoacyl-ACP synthase [Bacteroidota bacterium]